MNEMVNQLAQSLFKKNSLQECSRRELEILADKYPYFGIAQFMLAGKLKEKNDEAYKKQVQKTSLYFNNPLWLDYTLNNKLNRDTEPVIVNEPERDQAAKGIEERKTEPAEVVVLVSEEPAPAPIETEESIAIEAVLMEGPEEEINIAPLKMEPAPDENAPLEFQAFHTVDYFASQGIKLKTEDVPKDRFGQQLKSFTEWLKTLKKVPASEIVKEIDKGVEQKVITLAEHSVENREIVTETMAEVWVKQGNREKALEVYNKLSLQNPAKSSYFASLIEQLKKQ